MSRRRSMIVILGTAAALAAAGSGNASSLDSGQSGLNICGPTGHVNLSGPIEQKVPLTYNSKLKAAEPAAVQPFYRINLNASNTCATALTGAFTYFIPRSGEVEIVGKNGAALWVKLAPRVATKLRNAVSNVKPYGRATTLASVAVDHRAAADPSSYLRLYRIGTPASTAPHGMSWLQITTFGGGLVSPWTDGRNRLFVSGRSHDYIKRDGQLVHIRAWIAARIRNAKSLKR